jgi:hypothetical protein
MSAWIYIVLGVVQAIFYLGWAARKAIDNSHATVNQPLNPRHYGPTFKSSVGGKPEINWDSDSD